jgi:hypothetical protein
MSIVMTDENGITRAWEVSPDVFEDVGVYLQVRTVGRVVEKKRGTTQTSNEKGLPSSSRAVGPRNFADILLAGLL